MNFHMVTIKKTIRNIYYSVVLTYNVILTRIRVKYRHIRIRIIKRHCVLDRGGNE